METLGIGLLCLAALGICALSMKYLFGPAPAAYHIAILDHDGVKVTHGHKRVFGAIYAVMGSFALAIAILLAVLAVFPVAAGEIWAQLTLLVVTGVVGYGGCIVPWRVEQATGVQTPWRPGAVLVFIILIGLGLTAL